MAGKRSYGDPCGIARALDLVGERWGLLVVRELLLGPKRFTDLRAGLPNLSPDVLSQRLRDFERAGIAHRRKLAPPAGSWVYELTGWGHELEPVVLALGRFGSRAPLEHVGNELGTDSLMLALKTLFDDDAAAGLDAGYELRLGEEIFRVRVAGGVLAFAAMFERMSPQSRMRRYLSPKRSLTSRELRYLTDVDHVRHSAVAAIDASGRFTGVARYAACPDDASAAEVAVEVLDDWQRRG